MKRIVVAVIMLVAVLLTACAPIYNIEELEIDRDDYPGWYADLRKHGGYDYLDVHYSGSDKSEPMEKMTYMVFESSAEARKLTELSRYFQDVQKTTPVSSVNPVSVRQLSQRV